jgi:hypothetical protein
VYVVPRMFEQDRGTFTDGASRLVDVTPMCAPPSVFPAAALLLALFVLA